VDVSNGNPQRVDSGFFYESARHLRISGFTATLAIFPSVGHLPDLRFHRDISGVRDPHHLLNQLPIIFSSQVRFRP
jgi:hypothetical protein